MAKPPLPHSRRRRTKLSNQNAASVSAERLEALRGATEERLAQSLRLFNTTRDGMAWEDYRRAVRYFEDVLAIIHDYVPISKTAD